MSRFFGVVSAAALSSAFALCPLASAQTPGVSPNSIQPETTITLNGHGVVDHEPDIVHIFLGVQVEAPTASAAMSGQAQKMNGVFGAVKAAGIADKDMQTSNISLNAVYSYPKDQPPLLTGYRASNQLNIKVRDIKSLAKRWTRW